MLLHVVGKAGLNPVEESLVEHYLKRAEIYWQRGANGSIATPETYISSFVTSTPAKAKLWEFLS